MRWRLSVVYVAVMVLVWWCYWLDSSALFLIAPMPSVVTEHRFPYLRSEILPQEKTIKTEKITHISRGTIVNRTYGIHENLYI